MPQMACGTVEVMATIAAPPDNVRPADKAVELRTGLHYSVLAAAYLCWQEDGLFPLIFHRCPEMSLWDFLDWNYRPTVEPVGCFAGDRLVGMGWIVQARRLDGRLVAEVGAAFFKRTPLTIWRRALEMLMDHAFVNWGFAEVYGQVATHNRLAGLLTRWCGMVEAERLPWGEGTAANCTVYSLDRKTWAVRSQYGARAREKYRHR